MLEINQIYCGDNLVLIKQLDDNCIDMSIQSPPYDSLRKYRGFSWDFENLAKELYRVTKDGGVCVWVVADSTINGSETGSSFRQALYFKEIGFNIHDTMLYAKNNYVPLTHNRYEQQFEYMFIFSKGKPKTFNPIKVDCKTNGAKRHRLKNKSSETTYSVRARDEITITKEQKIKPNIWYYNVGSGDKTSHTAPFPEDLVKDHVISWSNENDLVLDTFNGSGTTTKIAKLLKRNYLGFELSQEYCDIANERLKLVC